MEVYLNPFEVHSLDVDVGQGFEDVSDVGGAGQEDSNGLVVFLAVCVLKEVESGRHAPILDVTDLVDYLHLNVFKLCL